MPVYQNTLQLNDAHETSKEMYQLAHTSSNHDSEHLYTRLNFTRQKAVEANISSTYQNIPAETNTDIVGPYEIIFDANLNSVRNFNSVS